MQCRDYPAEQCVTAGHCVGRYSEFGNGTCFRTEEAKLKEMGLEAILARMPERHARRWCTSAACACLGCANGIQRFGFTKADWDEWMTRNTQGKGENDVK